MKVKLYGELLPAGITRRDELLDIASTIVLVVQRFILSLRSERHLECGRPHDAG